MSPHLNLSGHDSLITVGGDPTPDLKVRYWPKADTRGRILGPKFGHPAFSELLSVRLRPKADTRIPSAIPVNEVALIRPCSENQWPNENGHSYCKALNVLL
jgi:hypothetical protein